MDSGRRVCFAFLWKQGWIALAGITLDLLLIDSQQSLWIMNSIKQLLFKYQ
jgi:hypothetical protein